MQDTQKSGLFNRLSKTRTRLSSGLSGLFSRGAKLNDAWFDDIEEQLIMADIGIRVASNTIETLRNKAKKDKLQNADQLLDCLKDQMSSQLQAVENALDIEKHQPFVILMVGVNGVGKTTTTAKLSKYFKDQGKSVMLAAGDTFRAAAIEQLQDWGKRLAIPVIAQKHGADAAAVAFDAYQSAVKKSVDVLIIDTAGRQHTQGDLMDQLAKMTRVLQKANENLPHEVVLVLDANTGQNTLSQTEHFKRTTGVTSLIVTKLDGTAKGGILVAIAEKYGLPIRFIGVGESMDDLRPFVAQDFTAALLDFTLS